MVDDDRSAIADVLNLYAFALDAHQWDLFDLVFTQDAHAEFGPAGAIWSELQEFKDGFAAFHSSLDSHQHTMMGQLIRVEGDVAYAFSYGNWLLIRHAAEGGSSWTGTGWYDDELVRTSEGWRISSRICRLQGWSGNPLVPEPTGIQNPDMGLRVLHTAAAAGEIGFLKALTASHAHAG